MAVLNDLNSSYVCARECSISRFACFVFGIVFTHRQHRGVTRRRTRGIFGVRPKALTGFP